MAVLPTPEGAARLILKQFTDRGLRAGAVLHTGYFRSAFNEPPFQSSDFPLGLEYAEKEGWIEVVGTTAFKLTDAGFSAA